MIQGERCSELYSHRDGLYSNLIKLTIINYRLFAAIIVGGVFINYITGDNMLRTSVTYFGISVFSYAVHRLMHRYDDTFLGKIHAIHHNPKYKDHIITEIIEVLVNLTIIGGLLWIPIIMVLENYVGLQLANHYVILAWAIIFTTYHLINYHVLSHTVHAQHHTERGVNNYGPELYDIICNTKAENSEIEDMNNVIVNIIVTLSLVLYLKNTSYDVVSMFSHAIQ